MNAKAVKHSKIKYLQPQTKEPQRISRGYCIARYLTSEACEYGLRVSVKGKTTVTVGFGAMDIQGLQQRVPITINNRIMKLIMDDGFFR